MLEETAYCLAKKLCPRRLCYWLAGEREDAFFRRMLSCSVSLSYLLPLFSWSACRVMSRFKLLLVDLSLPDPCGQWLSFGSWLTMFESIFSKKKHFCFLKQTIMNVGLSSHFSSHSQNHTDLNIHCVHSFTFTSSWPSQLKAQVCAVASAYCKQSDLREAETQLRVLFTRLL